MIEKILKILDEYKYITISIIGYMRTGKTNLAYCIANAFKHKYSDVELHYITYKYNIIFKKLRNSRKENVIVILDDLSYSNESRDRVLAHFLARAYHICSKCKHLIIVIIAHYIHSIMPFARITPVRFLSSVLTEYEIDILKKYYSLQALWDFYSMKIRDPISNRFVFLANIYGDHRIIKTSLCSLDYK